jgi:hypothetical protein
MNGSRDETVWIKGSYVSTLVGNDQDEVGGAVVRWEWWDGLGARTRFWSRIAVAVLAVALAALAWALVPVLYPDPILNGRPLTQVDATREATRTQAIVTTRASVLAALAGLGALFTIAINYRNSQTNIETLRATQATFRVTERGHQTGRYTAAIEQLGNADSIAIRLGGIYALEQLAVDSGRRSDQATVVEVLSAFVRVTATPPAHAVSLDSVGAAASPDADNGEMHGGPGPAVDVQAALTVLGRLPHLEHVPRADLAGAYLPGADLGMADLAGADLGGVDLTGAHLAQVDLTGASLLGATLIDAYLGKATLTGAVLVEATLAGAVLARADLTNAALGEAILTGADLTMADLTRAYFDGVNLTGADLREATLTGADLTMADLTGTDLRGAVGAELPPERGATVSYGPDGTPGRPPSR